MASIEKTREERERMDKDQAQAYMKRVHKHFNDLHFDGKLKDTFIRLTNAKSNWGTYFRNNATYGRHISIARRLLAVAEWADFIDISLLEMCHQAVTEIDGFYREQHGPNFKRWCRKVDCCGLSTTSVKLSGTAAEKKQSERAKRKETNEKVRDSKERLYPRKYAQAQYYDHKAECWVQGMVACENDLAGKRWCFVVKGVPSSSWMIIPRENLRKLDNPFSEDEEALLTEKVNVCADYVASKRSRRRRRSHW